MVKPPSAIRTVSTVSVYVLPNIVLLLMAAALAFGTSGCSCSDRNERMDNIEDRVERGELIGLTEADIMDSFGLPEQEPIFRDWDANYWIRQQPSCIDDIWLLLEYEDGRVSAAVIMGD